MPGQWRYLSMLLAAGWAGVIFYLSSLPGIDTPPLFPHQDKLLHAIAYALLGFLVLGAMRPTANGHGRRQLLLAITMTAIYGALDEVHQHFVPGRMPDGLDVLADLAGAVFGVYALGWFLKRHKRK